MYFLASRGGSVRVFRGVTRKAPAEDEAPKKARLPGPERLARAPHRGARNISFDAGA